MTNFWVEVNKRLDLKNESFEKLKEIHDKKISAIKKSKGDDRKAVRKQFDSEIVNLLGSEKSKRFNSFEKIWKNPISLFNLRHSLNLSREIVVKIKKINKSYSDRIKEERKNASNDLSSTYAQKEAEILNVLSDQQKTGYQNIKSKIKSGRIFNPGR